MKKILIVILMFLFTTTCVASTLADNLVGKSLWDNDVKHKIIYSELSGSGHLYIRTLDNNYKINIIDTIGPEHEYKDLDSVQKQILKLLYEGSN